MSRDSDLAFSTKFRYMRVHKKGWLLQQAPVNKNVEHGLPYRPYIQVYADIGDGKLIPVYRNFSNSGDPASDPYFVEQSQLELTVQVDDTYVNFSSYDNTAPPSRTIKFYLKIYAEPIAQ